MTRVMIAEHVIPPDVVLLGPEWPTRALLRAQFVEEGYEVVATDAWPIPRQYLRPGMKPGVVIVDLHGLPEPDNVLAELRALIDPDRVLVVTALGTLPRRRDPPPGISRRLAAGERR